MKLSSLVSRPVWGALAALGVAQMASAALPPSAPPAVPDQLDLTTALRFALDNNFTIREARERIRQQEGVVVEARAKQIPNVAATGAYQYNDKDLSTTFPATDHGWTLQLTASQVLFSGGSVNAARKSADLTREAAILELKGVINDSLLDVRTKFYDVLLAREKIKVQEQNIELLKQQLKTATDRFDAGTTSSFEKLRAEVALANGQVPLITARNDYRLAIETLRQSLGYANNTPDNVRKVPEFLGQFDFTPQSFDLPSSLTSARENRPELQRLAKLTSARDESVTAVRGNYYPNLSAFGGYQARGGGDTHDGVVVGLQSSWAIFDGGATTGRVIQARSALEQAKLFESDAQLAIDVEVRRAYSSLQQANELAEASKKVVEQADEALRLANARYSAGTATQLDVLTSQVDLTTARTNQLQAYYSYNVAVARLRKSIGQADPLSGQ